MSPAARLQRTGASADTSALFVFLDQTHQRMQAELRHLNHAIDALAQGELPPAVHAQLKSAVRWFDTTARQHHMDEEKHLFPTLLASSDPHVVETTLRLRQDHGWIEQNWLEVGPQLSALVDGNHWIESETLQESVRLFTQLCLDHLVQEESLAYPQARAHMDAATLTAAEHELAQRRKTYAARAAKCPLR
ncbi:MAG: hemerythrin domain-containing protein [Burkholderiaceae bacterium]|nr:hemerythrin domain-containing protein [Burkholderiaceae bacterium]